MFFQETCRKVRNCLCGLIALQAMKPYVFLLLWLAAALPARPQDCRQPFSTSTPAGQINWSQFPDFSLPFTLVYGGPRLGDTDRLPLRKGFSHLATFSGNDASQLPVNRRALLWYGVAFGLNQPWETLLSPWGNDASAYRQHWSRQLRDMADGFDDSRGQAVPKADLLVADVERFLTLPTSMLSLRNNPATPEAYRSLSDDAFLTRYRSDLTQRYTEPLAYARQQGFTGRLSSYSDVPVRNQFLNIDTNTWPDWTTNPERLHYFFRENASGSFGGGLYPLLDVLTPTAYYTAPYPSPLAGYALAYLLFQLEANQAWSRKPVVPVVWLRYKDDPAGTPLPPETAEATAIFPLMAGAAGLWLWESPGYLNAPAGSLAVYEHFVHGLHRLSGFRDFFDGGSFVSPRPARDHFAAREAIWRGVLKGNRLLVAAQNPFAEAGQPTALRVQYGSFSTTLQLQGREVFLCAFTLPDAPAAAGLSLGIAPNPVVAGELHASLQATAAETAQVQLVTVSGKNIHTQSVSLLPGPNALTIRGLHLAPGLYLLRVQTPTASLSKRVVVK